MERQSVAGHILTVVDEQQRKLVDKTSVWLNGYYYKVKCSTGTQEYACVCVVEIEQEY